MGSSDRRLRVVTITRYAQPKSGGAEKLAVEFARRLDPARFRSYLCVSRWTPPEYAAGLDESMDGLRSEGIEVLQLQRRTSYSATPWRRLYRLLRQESIDIVHAHNVRTSAPGTVLGRLARVPVIVSHEHGTVYDARPGRKLLVRDVVARGSDVVLAVSDWDRRNIARLGIPPERIRVLRNGIDSQSFDGAPFRRELGIPDGIALIGTVGRLFSEKRPADLIRAVAILARAGHPVHCAIVGEGPQESELRALVADLGLEDRVSLLGHRHDVPAVIAAFDIAVLCSSSEGSPLAVIEFMAAGAAIVATNVGGVPELIEDGVHGLLVEPADPEALARAVARLLADSELAARLGRAAQERQRAELELDAAVERLQDLYTELAERKQLVPAR